MGGAAVAKNISDFLGCDIADIETKVAVIHCLGSYDYTDDKVQYEGIQTCAGAALTAGSVASCQYGCMGLGDCMRACEYGAISIQNGLATVNPALCRACSRCIGACPKNLIQFTPFRRQAVVLCSNCEKGAETNRVCKVGCIACKKCEKTCLHDAIHVTGNCSVVDPKKCVGCGDCVKVCPRHCIKNISACQSSI